MDDYTPRSPDLSALSSYNPLTNSQQAHTNISHDHQPSRPDSFTLPQSSYYQAPSSTALPSQTPSTFGYSTNPSHEARHDVLKMEVRKEEWLPHAGYITPTTSLTTAARGPAPAGDGIRVGLGGGQRQGRKGSNRSQQQLSEVEPRPLAPGDREGISVRTKFPVARIKRLVQADDEVGKVAQVTPPVVGKALELFMIQMTLASAVEAQSRGSKRLTAAHVKAAIQRDDKFDFLSDIGDKISDGPTSKSEGGEKRAKVERMASEEAADMDVDVGISSNPPGKRRGRKKKSREDD